MEKDLSLIVCSLKELRQKKGYTQSELADLLGIKRQAVYDIESGRYLPNTLIALRIAKIFGVPIEHIFEEKTAATREVELVEDIPIDSRVAVVKVRDRYICYPAAPNEFLAGYAQAADGLYIGDKTVQFLKSESIIDNTVAVLGCDPAFSILSSYVCTADTAMLYRFASTRAALDAIANGLAHVAGVHMHSKTSNPSSANIELAHQIMGDQKIGIVSFASYDEGLIVAPGNPLGIRGPEDFAHKDIRFVNREPGAAVRFLIEDALKDKGMQPSDISGFDKCVYSHNEGAQLVYHGLADVALGMRNVAETYRLSFIPLASVQCDLVIPYDFWENRSVRVLLDTLQTKRLRMELQALPGYDTSTTGDIIEEP